MTPAGMLEKISTDEVFERTYSAGQLMSDEKAKEVYVEELPLVKIGYVKSPKHSL